jgi:D-alanyl-D-alanine carboxypeptidase
VPAATAAPGARRAAPAYTRSGDELQRLLEAEHQAGMPGLFAEVRDGGDRWRGAAGVADVDGGHPARPGMRHRVGSITKTFVATTVLQLVGEGRVDLDAPVDRYLPDLLPRQNARRVTVRMLLNHTSGIGDYDTVLFQTYDDVERWRRRTITPRELVAIGLSEPWTNSPGAAWSYSNTNYILLGLLVEEVTGRPYAAEVRRRILRPLGLRDTYFPGTDPRIRGPHMRAYIPWPDGTLRDFSVYNMSWAWAAGELISTTRDLDVFYRALLSGRLLTPALMAQMQDTVPMDPSVPEAGGYGLGIYWLALPCGLGWGHDGGVIGQTTLSVHSADGSRQVSMAENMNFYDAPAIDEARIRFLLTAFCGPQTEARTTSVDGIRLRRTSDLALSLRALR